MASKFAPRNDQNWNTGWVIKARGCRQSWEYQPNGEEKKQSSKAKAIDIHRPTYFFGPEISVSNRSRLEQRKKNTTAKAFDETNRHLRVTWNLFSGSLPSIAHLFFSSLATGGSPADFALVRSGFLITLQEAL